MEKSAYKVVCAAPMTFRVKGLMICSQSPPFFPVFHFPLEVENLTNSRLDKLKFVKLHLTNSRPVHSLMLFSHLFLCPPGQTGWPNELSVCLPVWEIGGFRPQGHGSTQTNDLNKLIFVVCWPGVWHY